MGGAFSPCGGCGRWRSAFRRCVECERGRFAAGSKPELPHSVEVEREFRRICTDCRSVNPDRTCVRSGRYVQSDRRQADSVSTAHVPANRRSPTSLAVSRLSIRGERRLAAVPAPPLREHRVDVEPAAPFEAGDPRQPRDDLDVPVSSAAAPGIERGGVDDVIVGGSSRASSSLLEHLLQHRFPVPRSPAAGCSRSGWNAAWAGSRSRTETGWRTGRRRRKLGVSSTIALPVASSCWIMSQ